MPPMPATRLPEGIRARILPGINGLSMHVLEAGDPSQPLLLLLHGFPELAWSWRRVMPGLAALGYHVVAPDQRGYGRTTGWSADYDGDLAPFRMLNLVRDAMGLIAALGHREAAAVIGHDFGSPVAAWCALVRPDLFRRVALMSAPFGGPPGLPEATPGRAPAADIHAALAALPRPRKHYQWYYSEPGANAAGAARLSTRLLSHEIRRLAGQSAVPVGRVGGDIPGRVANLLHHGPGARHGGDGRARDARSGSGRRLPLAAGRGS